MSIRLKHQDESLSVICLDSSATVLVSSYSSFFFLIFRLARSSPYGLRALRAGFDSKNETALSLCLLALSVPLRAFDPPGQTKKSECRDNSVGIVCPLLHLGHFCAKLSKFQSSLLWCRPHLTVNVAAAGARAERLTKEVHHLKWTANEGASMLAAQEEGYQRALEARDRTSRGGSRSYQPVNLARISNNARLQAECAAQGQRWQTTSKHLKFAACVLRAIRSRRIAGAVALS